jgi:hypothetical protein
MGPRVSLLIDLEAHSRQPAQRIHAHRGGVLSDAGGEGQSVGTVKDRQIRADVLAQPVDEHVIGQLRCSAAESSISTAGEVAFAGQAQSVTHTLCSLNAALAAAS